MQYREMQKLNLKVSALGFGTMRLPGQRFMKFQVDAKKSIKIIRRGIDLGINYIDTAYIYHFGVSEKVLGEALKNGYREKVFIADKLPMFLMRKAEDFDRYLEIQLKRLGTDNIDFYLFHSMNRNYLRKMLDMNLLEKMENAKKRGLIKYIGFSFHDTLPVFKNIIDLYSWDMTQIQYNYLDTGVQATQEGLRYAYEKEIPVVIMEGLRGGQLANPPQEALKIMNRASSNKTPVEWAFQFLWNQKEVTTVLSGMNSLEMVEENCRYADRSGVDILTKEELKVIESLVEIYQKKILVGCTACQYCMPCPSGVNIPENFAQINLANGPKGIFQWMINRNYRKLASHANKVNKNKPNGNASLCTRCKACVVKCPQGIDIPAELERVHLVMGKKKKIAEVFGR